MADLQSRIALEVHRRFEALPAKSKPGLDENGQHHWVPLSGIVLSAERGASLQCVALGTGMKCLPQAKVSGARGLVLHDWHAETLAIRLFNDFLIQEIRNQLETNCVSTYVRKRHDHELSHTHGLQPFTIRENVEIYMYCSEAPCGDASMELIMSAQEDPTPWPLIYERDSDKGTTAGLKGRGFFSELGIVRRKPARADSPPTLSKSCSDKLAIRQFTSLLLSSVSLLLSPKNAYTTALIIPKSQYVQSACCRAFSAEGRLKKLVDKSWQGGYSFQPFQIMSVEHEFAYSRRVSGPKSSNISAVWNIYRQETLVNGVLQGRKQSDLRGASAISRRMIWENAVAILSLSSKKSPEWELPAQTYDGIKQSLVFLDRRQVKAEVRESSLSPWIPNVVDDFQVAAEIKPS